MTPDEFIELIRLKYPRGFSIDIEKKYKRDLVYVSNDHKGRRLSETLKHRIELWGNDSQSKWFVRTRLKLINDKEYGTEYTDFKIALKTFQRLVGSEVFFYEVVKISASDVLSLMS